MSGRRETSRPRSRLAALALCGLLAAGCGDSPEEANGGGDSGEVAANARAASINVSLSDLPEGYAAVPDSEGGDGEGEAPSPLEGCIASVEDAAVADADSPTFRRQTGAGLFFLASETSVLAESGPAEAVIASLQDQATLDCLSERLGQVLASILPGATIEAGFTLTPDGDFPELGDGSVALSGNATFVREGTAGEGTAGDATGEPISVNSSLVFVRTGDAISVLLFGALQEPFPPDTLESVARAVAARQS